MEDSKSHSLLSTGWSPGKAGHVAQCESKGLSIRGAKGVNPRLRAGEDEMRHSGSSSEAGEKGVSSSFLRLLFYSSPRWMGLVQPCREEENILLSPLIQMLIPFRNTFIDTSRNNV